MRSSLRTLGYVWALPNSLIGLPLGLLSFQRPRVKRGVLVFDRARRGFLWLFGRTRWRAITFGHVVLSVRPLEGRLLAHELEHVRQHALLGPLFLPSYVLMHVFTGYRDNPFEAAARRASDVRRAGPAGVRASGRGGWWRPPSPPPR